MTPMIFLVALTTSMPMTNLDSVCHSAKEGALPGQDQASAFQSCLQDEKTARDELQQKWGHFSASARETCAEPKGVTFSYVELLTCLEMQTGSEFNQPQTPPLTPQSSPATQSKPADAVGQKP
jgi:hypothetical protein